MGHRYGWHFRKANGALSYNDGRTPKVGERLQALRKGRRVTVAQLCRPGFHALPEVDGQYRRDYGPRVSFVLVEGVPDCHMKTNGKFVGTHRTILWEALLPVEAHTTREIREFIASTGFSRAAARAKAQRLGLIPKRRMK